MAKIPNINAEIAELEALLQETPQIQQPQVDTAPMQASQIMELESALSDIGKPRKGPNYKQALLHGAREQLLPLGTRLLAKASEATGMPEDITSKVKQFGELKGLGLDPEYQPETAGEHAVSMATSLADPLFFLGPVPKVLQKVGKSALAMTGLAKKGKDLRKAWKAIEETTKINPSTAYNQALDFNRVVAQHHLKEQAVRLGAEFSVFSGGVETARQVAEGTIDPASILAHTATGAVLGAGLGASGAGLGRLTGYKTEQGIRQKAFSEFMEQAEKEAAFAESVTRDMGADKWTTAERTNFIMKSYQEAVDASGIPIYKQPIFKSKFAKLFVKGLERFSRVDALAGTRSFDVAMQGVNSESAYFNRMLDIKQRFKPHIDSLAKKGVKPDDIPQILQYRESVRDAQGKFTGQFQWNPNRVVSTSKRHAGTVIREQANFNLNAFDSITPELDAMRAIYDDIWSKLPDLVRSEAYVPGYITFMSKKTPGKLQRRATPRRMREPGFEKAKQRAFDVTKHETNMWELIDKYARDVAAKQIFATPQPGQGLSYIDNAAREINKLMAVGQRDAARDLANYVSRTMNLDTNRQLADVFANQVAGINRHIIDDVASQTAQPSRFADEIIAVIKNLMYNNLVFSNPRTILKQYFQPRLVADAEIGAKWTSAGRTAWITKKYDKAEMREAMDLLRARDPEILREMDRIKIDNKILKAIDKALFTVSPARFLGGKYLFNKLDIRNRGVVYLGAKKQMLHTLGKEPHNLERALDGLLFGEKQAVRRAIAEGQPEAAARLYGIVRSRRANYAYGMADMPVFLASDLGRMIPFKTWGINQMNRIAQDIGTGNVKMLAKRIAIPLVYLHIFSGLTGYDVPTALPATAAISSAQLQAIPLLAQSAEEFSKAQGDLLNRMQATGRILTFFTPIQPFKRLHKGVTEGNILEEFGRLKRTKHAPLLGKLFAMMREDSIGAGSI